MGSGKVRWVGISIAETAVEGGRGTAPVPLLSSPLSCAGIIILVHCLTSKRRRPCQLRLSPLSHTICKLPLLLPEYFHAYLSHFQVMTAAAAAFRRAVLEADPRLAEAMYLAQVLKHIMKDEMMA